LLKGEGVLVVPFPNIPLGAGLTEAQAYEIVRLGPEAAVFALLQLAQRVAELERQLPKSSPTAPSGMKPAYEKPPAQTRSKRPGCKKGHPGHRRPPPERIDRRKEHQLERCPDCGTPVKKCHRVRRRYVEDIPENLKAEVTEHTIHRDWCPKCKKSVEPVVSDALPNSALGNRVLVLTAWLHYALGNTLSQIIEVFNFHLPIKLTSGGLSDQWRRLGEILEDWYETLRHEALRSAVLHADETSWRVMGKTHWLWCFAAADLTYFMIDRCRGSPALMKFFTQEFSGTLISDFWGAYNKVLCARRQLCLVHLLRDFLTVEKYKRPGPRWPEFAKKAKRLIHDAIRLGKRDDITAEEFSSRRVRLNARLQELIETPWKDSQAKRLIKRLRRHQHQLFTFLDQPDVPFENNHGERSIRPAVIMRKNSYCNRSPQGAKTQAVLMSVYRTLKQRGLDPVAAVAQALSEYVKTGKLPPLPLKTAASG
jgi:transposase